MTITDSTDVTLTHCTFTKNQQGLSAKNSHVTLAGCGFYNNVNIAGAGGLSLSNSNGRADRCEFGWNQGQNGGGAQLDVSQFEFNGCEFFSNNAQRGAALYATGCPVILTSTSFYGNNNTDDGTIYAESGSTLTMNNVAIYSNNAQPFFYSGLVTDRSDVTMTNCTMDYNTGGGAKIVAGNSIDILNSSFSHNFALPGLYLNGILRNFVLYRVVLTFFPPPFFLLGNSIQRVVGCTINYNNASVPGAGLYVFSASALQISQITIEDTTINGNVASDENEGGGLYLKGADATLRNVALVNNTGATGGGAYFLSSVVKIFSSDIAENVAKKAAGGVFIEDSRVDFTDAKITNNTAKGKENKQRK